MSRPLMVDTGSITRYDYANDATGRRIAMKYKEIAMQTLSGLPTNMPVIRVEFDYDYMSRRVGKMIWQTASMT
jgi:hypothetical protein